MSQWLYHTQKTALCSTPQAPTLLPLTWRGWYRCPIEHWALHGHLYSALWPLLSLWSKTRFLSPVLRTALIYRCKHQYLEGHLINSVCPFSKTTVVASPLGPIIISWVSEWVYSIRHKCPPAAWASDLIRVVNYPQNSRATIVPVSISCLAGCGVACLIHSWMRGLSFLSQLSE